MQPCKATFKIENIRLTGKAFVNACLSGIFQQPVSPCEHVCHSLLTYKHIITVCGASKALTRKESQPALGEFASHHCGNSEVNPVIYECTHHYYNAQSLLHPCTARSQSAQCVLHSCTSQIEELKVRESFNRRTQLFGIELHAFYRCARVCVRSC